MLHLTFFNPLEDNLATREGLSIDLSQALYTGVVKDSGIEPEFNNIEDPSKIRGRYNDVFTALDERNAVLHKASVKSSENKAGDVSNGQSD